MQSFQTLLAQLEAMGPLLVAFLAAWVLVCKAASAICGALGAWSPAAARAAAWLDKASTKVHEAAADLTAWLPATTAKRMAKAAAKIAVVLVLFRGVSACTPAQSANAIQVTNMSTTALEQACVDAAIVAPLLDSSLPPADEAALKTACPAIASFADSVIDQMIATFTQAQPAVAAKVMAHKRAWHAAAK